MIDLGNFPISVTAAGSRVTCNPPPLDTDRDWLVLVAPERFADLDAHLIHSGWEAGGSDIPDEANEVPPELRFVSYTLGVENVIATVSPEFHRRFLAATAVSRHLNLMNKPDRIALFQAVLYGNDVTPPAMAHVGETESLFA